MILPGDDGRVPSVSNHIDKYGSTADGEIATEEPVANGHVVEDTDKNRQHDSGQANPGTSLTFRCKCSY